MVKLFYSVLGAIEVYTKWCYDEEGKHFLIHVKVVYNTYRPNVWMVMDSKLYICCVAIATCKQIKLEIKVGTLILV